MLYEIPSLVLIAMLLLAMVATVETGIRIGKKHEKMNSQPNPREQRKLFLHGFSIPGSDYNAGATDDALARTAAALKRYLGD